LSSVNLLELFFDKRLDFLTLTAEVTQGAIKISPRRRVSDVILLRSQPCLQNTGQKVLQTKAMISGLGLRFPQKLVRKIERRSHIAKLDEFLSRSRPEPTNHDQLLAASPTFTFIGSGSAPAEAAAPVPYPAPAPNWPPATSKIFSLFLSSLQTIPTESFLWGLHPISQHDILTFLRMLEYLGTRLIAQPAPDRHIDLLP
jgi:hypothetical protein